jgi:hypothetical protein
MQENYLTIESLSDYAYQALNIKGEVVYEFTYFPEEKYCLHHWISYLPDNEVIRIYELSMDFFNNHPEASIARSLTDITTYDGSFDGINEWLVTNLMPRVLAMGFKAGATILPKDFFAQLALEEYQEMAKNLPYQQGYFDNLETAREWLLQQAIEPSENEEII